MNFLDTYDISETATQPASEPGAPEPSLNEEVSQVVGQLGRLWGGFRKQSQTVFESARKEVGQVVSQAQKEISKLGTELDTQTASTSTSTPTAEDASAEAATTEPAAAPSEGSSSSSTEKDSSSPTTPTSARSHGRGTSVSFAAQNLFSRLQSALPSDLASTVQAKLPEAIKQGAGALDLAQLRSTLATEFQRVQGVTRAQAEEYVHKSEELLRDAGEFLKEAVKVVPPEEGGPVVPGVMWDGSDIWMLPEFSAGGGEETSEKGKGKAGKVSSAEGLRAVATRAEALLKQLKHDPEVIRVDPEAEERAAQMWNEWKKTEVESTEKGIHSERWESAVAAALGDPVDGEALKKTMDTLVPSAMDSDTFWKRYFFRVDQVSKEEQRRKALLQGTVDEEDFDWESDEDESPSPATKQETEPSAEASVKPDTPQETPAVPVKLSATSTPANSSPRRSESEDGSYDVVSSQVSNNGEAKEEEQKSNTQSSKAPKETEDDDDSDWE